MRQANKVDFSQVVVRTLYALLMALTVGGSGTVSANSEGNLVSSDKSQAFVQGNSVNEDGVKQASNEEWLSG